MSRAHEIAQELTEKGGQDLLGNLVRAVSETVLAETDAVFRTAYFLAKMNRPFSDHDHLIELQEKMVSTWALVCTQDTVPQKLWNTWQKRCRKK